jgi:L-rhamnose-H+ transport protein
MDQKASGLFLLVLAGAMNGSFTLPMKFTRKWAWENTWLVWTLFALGVLPLVLTLTTVPSLTQVYAQAGMGPALLAAAFGGGWGISQVFLGLAVDGIGMALSFSVILGISAAVGSIVPLVRLHPDAVLKTGGITVLGGVLLVLIGVGIAAIAGRRRETALASSANATAIEGKPSVAKGLLFATISGLGSALVNFGFAFGEPLKNAAQNFGTPQIWAPNAVWLPLMVTGGIPNAIYCIYLMSKNNTGARFRSTGTSFYWGLAGVMAFFWFASTVMYGVGATKLGALGPVLGWPLFMSLILITATVWGVSTGEWKHAGTQPLRIMGSSVAVLVVAIFVLGISSRMV